MIKAITVATIILVAAGVPPSRKAAYRRVYSIQRSSDRPVRCTTVTTPTCNCRQNPTRIGLGCGPNQVRPAISAPPRRSAQGLQVHHSAVPRLEGSIDYLRARVWPTAKNCRYAASAKGFKSNHPGGCNMLFADGSVHFLKKSINLDTYNALGSRNGGEVVSADSF